MPVWEGPGKYGPLKLAWEGGHLVVNSNMANQSYGNLHAVWQQCLGELGIARRAPADILIIGFGAGSAASILRKELGLAAPITGVDGDPEMLRLAREYFRVDKMDLLELVESDALLFASRCTHRYGLVLVDLCHELDLSPGVDSPAFINDLRKCTATGGVLCFNTIVHNPSSKVRSQRVSDLLRLSFNHVEEHWYQGINRVLTAT